MNPSIFIQTGLPTIVVSGEMVTYSNFWDSNLFWDEANVFWDAGTASSNPSIVVTGSIPTITVT